MLWMDCWKNWKLQVVVLMFQLSLYKLTEAPAGQLEQKTEGCEVPQLYLNTICLPRDEQQFQAHPENCFVAAWGRDPAHRVGQRDVAMPLVGKEECEQRLRPEFDRRGIRDWR